MLEDYSSRSNLSSDNYNGACVVSFTDGLDNESANGDEDLSYIYNTLLNKSIMGNTIEFYSIGFTGAEDFSRLQNMKFNEVMEKTSTDSEHSQTSDKFERIEKYFGDIARSLTDRWKIINLYTPQGHNGKKVRWVLPCGEPRPQPQPKPEYKPKVNDAPKFFLGFGVGFGYGIVTNDGYAYNDSYGGYYYGGYSYEYGENYFLLSPSVDFTWGLSDKHFVGANMRVGTDFNEDILFSFVPEYMFRFNNNSAIMAGIGTTFDIDDWFGFNADLRVGFKTRKSFFITGDMFFGSSFGMSLGIGWGFFGGGD